MTGEGCARPFAPGDRIQMAHGGGGRAMRELIESIFLPAFQAVGAPAAHDAAVLPRPAGRIAFTTDAFVVRPLFFPGGDIGKLAVCGTVNDLAMAAAEPLWMSAAFVLEEGTPLEVVARVAASMGAAAREAGVRVVTGDTKVVERGHGDGIFIATTGVGAVPDRADVRPERVRPGDRVLLSGDLGRHGMAVMAVREGLGFEAEVGSDCAPLDRLVAGLGPDWEPIHCLRDLTRGGLASALNEIARDAAVGIELDEPAIPVGAAVAGACEILGLDPLYVACEGRLAAIVAPEAAPRVLEALRGHPLGRDAALVGTVTNQGRGQVRVRSALGGTRVAPLLSGEQLPRIC